ncbi:MAG TPA: alpha-amylase family glycosyl hydrolase [Daejeonella sp.]|nr:alpha-amylase family glycosyl hydrolase [Daejeonella sp.]
MATNQTEENVTDNKLVIYQMMVRLFGNKDQTNKHYGSIEENGSGKFNDITDIALDKLKDLGISHVWYTGVIEHATMTDYTSAGIKMDDPDVVKGRAGSPYAIKDYYDVDPDLAVDVANRMKEFDDLVKRTHDHDLKVIIDFVPNHVARHYVTDNHRSELKDFGADDDISKEFDSRNDFYYITGKNFKVPQGVNAGGNDFHHPLKDGRYDEYPAKATGNNVFSESPSINDWFETVKLNYGIDYRNKQTHFDPIPPVWNKMRDILLYWTARKVDGFRCDMAEEVPVEFWSWVIPEIKKANPNIIFIAEAYNSQKYASFLTTGKFDFLYDKVGLYDGLKKLIRNEAHADVKDITHVWSVESKGFSSRMVRFLENHDEERIASPAFAGNAWYAKPAMVVSATLSTGPVMIYFGQESGEPGHGNAGFAGENNRTTIFDYWGVPEHQKWMNGGAFDGKGLNEDQHYLRGFYSTLLNAARTEDALRKGEFLELANQHNFSNRNYAYLRYTSDQRILVVANFERERTLDSKIHLPQQFLAGIKNKQNVQFRDILTGKTFVVDDLSAGIPVNVATTDAWILTF